MDTLLFIGFVIFALVIYNRMREGILNNNTWRALLSTYPTTKDAKSPSVVPLNLVYNYFDGVYFKRIFKFYKTDEGLLIVPSAQFFIKQRVLIPWSALKPTGLQQRNLGTMQELEVADVVLAKMEIMRTDFVQHIRPQLAKVGNGGG
ncbi:MAG: hypothetical protein HRU41_33910 [Saprospiraceae bacterium]|nr:hypothetical protein [Saprospiraceae bacterium]